MRRTTRTHTDRHWARAAAAVERNGPRGGRADTATPGTLRVRVLLVNLTPDQRPGPPRADAAPDPLLQERALFDAGLVVVVESADIVPFEFLLAPRDYPIESADDGQRHQLRRLLSTQSLPIDFSRTPCRVSPAALSHSDDLQEAFATLDVPDPMSQLERIAAAMDDYLAAWRQFLQTDAMHRFTQDELAACRRDSEHFRDEIARYRLLGI